MLPFAWYIIKLILCSGVLFGYYWLFLRNKIFHSYNRFYLLAIIVISFSLPLFHINVWHKAETKQPKIIQMIQVVNSGDEYMDDIVQYNRPDRISKEQIFLLLYLAVSAIFVFMFVQALYRINRLLKTNASVFIQNIHFIKTNAKGTPFSFLKYIFWNDAIDINTKAGGQIFKHEVAHVQEKHSYDKLFINAVLIVCWCNPFFWLIRRELNIIHEFIADKKAVEDGNVADFAAMILQATYPQHRFAPINSFFYSPIKRRLLMLTKQNKNKVNYISRLLVLPLAVIVFAAFSIKAKTYADKIITDKNDKIFTVVIDAGHGGKDGGALAADGTMEKDLNLLLAKKIKELNTSSMIRIVMSREADFYQDPKEKALFANNEKADLLISIHMAARQKNTSQAMKGMEIYIAKDEFGNSAGSKLFASAIISNFKTNYKLNVPLHPTQQQKGIWVLQASKCPAVLIEAGYITDAEDLAYLQSAGGREEFARNVLNAISSFIANKDYAVVNEILRDTLPAKIKSDEPVQTLRNVAWTLKEDDKVIITADSFSFKESKENKSFHALIIINGKEYTYPELKNKTIAGSVCKFYSSSNPDIRKKYGAKAANGVYIFENAKIENIANEIKVPALADYHLDTLNTAAEYVIDASQYTNLKGNDKSMVRRLRNMQPLVNKPIFLLNGKEIDQSTFKTLDESRVASLQALQPTDAIKRYGDKAKNGAVEIFLKPDPSFSISGFDKVYIDIAEIKNLKALILNNPEYVILNYTVYLSGEGFPQVIMSFGHDESLKPVENYFDKLVAGSVMTFDNIKIAKKDGSGEMVIDGRAVQFFSK